jgi:hypothetical protein
MKTKLPSIERIGLTIGIVTSLALIGYFLLMKVLGFEQIIELRFFNFLILGGAICYGINKLKRELHEDEFYLKGWAQGIFISAIATVVFATFMGFYITYYDTSLLQYIQHRMNVQEAGGLTVFVAILMEGMASGFVITLCAMQYFKSPGDIKSRNIVK